MVEYFAQIIASLLSVALLGIGSLGTTDVTVAELPVPGPVVAEATEAPVAEEASYPAYPLWDMPHGVTSDEVLAVIQEKTGQTPALEDNKLTLYGADNLSLYGYTVDLFAEFGEPYNGEGSGVLTEISFDLNLSGKENFGVRQPVESRDSLKQVATGIVPRIEEITGNVLAEFGPFTDTRVAVWKENDSELEYVPAPISLDGTLDTDQLLDIITTYQTVLFHLYFDNVDVMFYTAFRDEAETYYVLSPSIAYIY